MEGACIAEPAGAGSDGPFPLSCVGSDAEAVPWSGVRREPGILRVRGVGGSSSMSPAWAGVQAEQAASPPPSPPLRGVMLIVRVWGCRVPAGAVEGPSWDSEGIRSGLSAYISISCL